MQLLRGRYLVQHVAHSGLKRLAERPGVLTGALLPAVQAVEVCVDGHLGASVDEAEEHFPLEATRLAEGGPEGDDLKALSLDVAAR